MEVNMLHDEPLLPVANYVEPRKYTAIKKSQNPPTIDDIKPHQIIVVIDNQTATAYWMENGKIINKSFPENEVHDIVSRLPTTPHWSNDAELINATVAQYGCSISNIRQMTVVDGTPYY